MIAVDYNDKNYDYTKYWDGRDYEKQAEFLAISRLLPKKSKSPKSVIDIGGGFGRLVPIFKDRFNDISVLDYSQKLLDIAEANAKRENILIKTIQSDIYNLSQVINKKYDCAVMVRVSHHLNDLPKVFMQIHDILELDGVFVLEIANKTHFKSVVKHLIRGDFAYFKRDSVSITENEVTFLNHHPKEIEQMLLKTGFTIEKRLSVSNFRSPYFKKLFSLRALMALESFAQTALAPFYFGPSIFYKLKRV